MIRGGWLLWTIGPYFVLWGFRWKGFRLCLPSTRTTWSASLHFLVWGLSLMGLPLCVLLFPDHIQKWSVAMYWWLLFSIVACTELSIMFNPDLLEDLGAGTAYFVLTLLSCALYGIVDLEAIHGSRQQRPLATLILLCMVLGAFVSGIPHLVLRSDSSYDVNLNVFALLKSSDDVRYVANLFLMAMAAARRWEESAETGLYRHPPLNGFKFSSLLSISRLLSLGAAICEGLLFLCGLASFMGICRDEITELVRAGTERLSVSQRCAIAYVRATLGVYIIFILYMVHVYELVSSWLWWSIVPFCVCAMSLLLLSAAHTFAIAKEVLKQV